jgi:hypothetical protein
MAGIRDAFLLVDRASGRALTITLWDSEEAMAASAVGATQVRQEATGAAGGRIEVGRGLRGRAAPRGCGGLNGPG